MILLEVIYEIDENNKFIARWGDQPRDMIVLNPTQSSGLVRITLRGLENGIPFQKEVQMNMTNDMKVPVVDTEGNPVMVDDPDNEGQQVQKTIGEFDAWIATYFSNLSEVSVKTAMEVAIKRKLGVPGIPALTYTEKDL